MTTQKLSLREGDLDLLWFFQVCCVVFFLALFCFSGKGKEQSCVLLGKRGWRGENEEILGDF